MRRVSLADSIMEYKNTQIMSQTDKPGKKYTYLVKCSFDLQFTFDESDLEQDSDGDVGDFSPKDEAIRALEDELREVLGNNYAIDSFEAYTDFEKLLGVD